MRRVLMLEVTLGV